MIYLDNAATTKPLREACEYASQFLEDFYNPSALYSGGIAASEFLKGARSKIVEKIASSDYECVFTSCGTEADNTAVFSFARRGNAVTTAGEHSAIYEPFRQLEGKGVEARFASLNADGSVNVADLLSKIDNKTSFVSVVHVNNETGAINDINAIAAAVKKKNPKAVFHSDGVQAFGKVSFRLSSAVDLYSVSAHKIGALKGVGALIKRKDLHLHPLIFGGGQEGGLRSGTENVYGIATFIKAADIRYANIKDNFIKITQIKNEFLKALCDDVKVISSMDASPYVITLAADGLKGEVLLHMLEQEGLIVGTGSACASRHQFSRVLKECGYANGILGGVLRVSFCPESTLEEALFAAEKISSAVLKLKKVINGQ